MVFKYRIAASVTLGEGAHRCHLAVRLAEAHWPSGRIDELDPPAEPFREHTDRLFAAERNVIPDFDFGKDTAAVFDDNARSLGPVYSEIQRMIGELAATCRDGTRIYDLGCSTANTFLPSARCCARTRRSVRRHRFVRGHAQKADQKLVATRLPLALRARASGSERRAAHRERVGRAARAHAAVRPAVESRSAAPSIYRGLNHNGCLILVEKVLGEHSHFNRLFIKHYYEMKRRNGYSELEIAQKREALENVLVPYRLEENKRLLRARGFQHVDVFFKWYNFCGIIAIK